MANHLLRAANSFTPTPASIPPSNAVHRMHLPTGLPVNVTPLNPISFILRAAVIYGDGLAIAHPDVKDPVFYSFAVWAQRVQNLAYALIKAGIRPGDRVAVVAPNCPLIADAHQGCLAARAVITPINTRLTKSDVEYILQHSQSKLVLVDHEYVHLVQDAKVPVVVSHDTGRMGDPYEEFLAQGRAFSKEKGWPGLEFELEENAAASLCYTSGTTGKPKGVISTCRGSYLAAIANAFESKLGRDAVYLWILPMFHACGWTYPWANTFAFATQITLRTVSYPLIWNHLLRSGVTHYCAAPTVQIGIVTSPDANKLPRTVAAIIAGAAPTANLIEQLERRRFVVHHVYGLTYTYGPFTRNYPQPEWDRLDLQARSKIIARQGHGFATADEARVVKPSSLEGGGPLEDVPWDGHELGEIVTRGNIVMKEYFRDPEATRKAFKGGYFASGDLAVRHPDGSIAIQDRAKDLIISGGENASSLAIETELSFHPDVQEVSVIARSHPKWGERPMAFAILTSPGASKWQGKDDTFAQELITFAKERLPGFACPEWVKIVEELPKTSTGKIQKVELRKIVAKL